jgi:putative aminopeptidase FrvX
MTPKLPAWLELARSLLNQPTAAVKEALPQKFLRDFAAARPNLKLSEDAAGNLRVDYAPSGAVHPPLVMVAHLDHPGFHIESIEGDIATLSFQGSVNGRHAIPGSRVEFFELGNPHPIGEGSLLERADETGALKSAKAKILSGRVASNGFAMWAFPGFSLEGDLIVTRCCDDLLGAAAALCVLDEIAQLAPPNVALTGFFTRAEELGFLGTLEAIRLETLPKNAYILSLECSKAFANAPQGAGVIVRVGDASSIFDTGLTHALTLCAKSRAQRDPSFKFQRKLMDGGSCEATPFCAHGYRASGLALPLGNYHNQAFDADNNPCMGPESVHVEDFRCEIELLIELALHPNLLDEQNDKVTPRLKELAATARKLLSLNAQ